MLDGGPSHGLELATRTEQLMRHAAYVFDAYGTLFDVHAAVRRHAGRIGAGRPAAVGDLARQAARIFLGPHADGLAMSTSGS